MGRDTGHLRLVSPGIFHEQLFIEKLLIKTTHRTEYFCSKQNFAIITCNALCYCCLRYSFSFIFNSCHKVSNYVSLIVLKIKQNCILAKIRIFAPNFQLWVQCAKCSRHPRALRFLPEYFYTDSHTFQGVAKIFEKRTFFRYTLLYTKQVTIIYKKLGYHCDRQPIET